MQTQKDLLKESNEIIEKSNVITDNEILKLLEKKKDNFNPIEYAEKVSKNSSRSNKWNAKSLKEAFSHVHEDKRRNEARKVFKPFIDKVSKSYKKDQKGKETFDIESMIEIHLLQEKYFLDKYGWINTTSKKESKIEYQKSLDLVKRLLEQFRKNHIK